MITQTQHYPKQMNGPVISAFGEAQCNEKKGAEAVIDYLYGLSINTAKETELENIGRIIGYPRPLVPEGFNEENIMLLGDLPLAQDPLIGLSTINSEVGGQLSTVERSETGFMSLGMYRKFLKNVAYIKRYGITLYAIDQIASLFANDYTITWTENGDINLHYAETIGYKNIWILTQLFYRMATAPQLIVTAG